MKMSDAFLVSVLILAAPVSGSEKSGKPRWQGSIAVPGKHGQGDLAKMPKVSEADARKTALAAVTAREGAKTVTEAELEVENGYLVWSCDVRVEGKKEFEEILVDAGNGKVLSREKESAEQEDREAKEERSGGSAAPPRLAIHSIALPGAPSTGVLMDYLAYDRAHHRVWVPAGNTGSVDVVDVASDRVTRVEGFRTAEFERAGTKRIVGPS